MSKLLTNQNFIDVANLLGCEVAAIKAVSEVEAPGGGFLKAGRPKILFEAHIFSAKTGHKYDTTHPNISSRRWNKKLYLGGEKEYQRLEQAKALNENAALQSASWGKFQTMGFNFKICGWADVKTYVDDMYISEAKHLKAFVGFIKSNNLAKYLISKDWVSFAKKYNGPGYEQNKYHIKMAIAYEKYAKEEKKTIVKDEPVIEIPVIEIPVIEIPIVKIPHPKKVKVVSKSIFEVIIDVILSIFKNKKE